MNDIGLKNIVRGLRPLVEDLLARLLETDETKAMSFEEFFSISKNIINKKVVSVFDCNSTKVLKIYMDPPCALVFLVLIMILLMGMT